jgi:hypothetical protein
LQWDCYEVQSTGSRGIDDPMGEEFFRATLTKWREGVRAAGADPLGSKPSEKLSTAELDEELSVGIPKPGG